MIASRVEDYRPQPKPDGYCSHDASGVVLAHNLILDNSHHGVAMRIVTNRRPNTASGQVDASNNRVGNNITAGNRHSAMMIPFPSKRSQGNFSEGNLLGSESRIVLSTGGGAAFEEMESVFVKAFTERPATTQAGPGEHGKPAIIELTLDEWRQVTSWGSHSQLCSLQTHLSRKKVVLQLSLDESAQRAICEPVSGLDKEFFGKPLPPGQCLPGPFQIIKPGRNLIALKSVLGIGAPPTLAIP